MNRKTFAIVATAFLVITLPIWGPVFLFCELVIWPIWEFVTNAVEK